MTTEPEPISPDPTISQPATRARSSNRTMWVLDFLLVVVLLAGAYLRTTGLYWGEYQYLHPDERFLVWVGTDISPTKIDNSGAEPKQTWLSVGEYFDTVNSSLNPNNRSHGFYVYGTLPMFITRFAVQWIFGHSGFDVMTQVGRALSALTDLLTVLMVYLIAARLYDKRVGLLAAAFSAAAVLQIQQSHFYTMDTFANLFTYLAIYFAVRIMTDRRPWPGEHSEASTGGEQANSSQPPRPKRLRQFFGHPLFWLSIAFGLAYGAAMASKISIVPVALLLPAAVAIRISAMPRQEWSRRAWQAFGFLAIAGLTSLVVFRLAQPYAFSGPGLLGVKLNPAWLQQIREQRAQATPEVDYPPAMQWARRPIWFSGQNLIIWGLGLPLGLLAVVSFLWAGWDMLKGNWRKHLLLWAWTGSFFIWQSMAINPTMRYQLPIYPALAIFAAWGVVHLWDIGKARRLARGKSRPGWLQIVAVAIGGSVLALTLVYAYGFASIYTRPITRIEGSRWIYQNIPGPINLRIETTPEEVVNQPLPFPYNSIIMPQAPYSVSFVPQASGALQEIYFPYIWDTKQLNQPSNLTVTLSTADGAPIRSTGLAIEPTNLSETGAPVRKAYTAHFESPVELNKGQGYTLKLEMAGEAPVAVLDNRASLRFITEFGDSVDLPAFPNVDNNWKRLRADTQFLAPNNGLLSEIFLPVNDANQITSQPLTMTIDARLEGSEPNPNPDQMTGIPTAPGDLRGRGYVFQLPLPTYLTAGQKVEIVFDMLENKSALTLSGAGIANEGEWDDGMPVRIDGYDGFGGIYPLDLNFNMYWDDNETKLERFLRILDESDYIVITSNRQWGSLTRIPERFPLTTLYYRNLLGCPADQDIVWCYRVAKPDMFQGNLGFELVKIFQSDPQIGSFTVNDQFGEEAFTVYDHPKVFIFKKTDSYDSQKVQDLLSTVDFSKVIRLAPLKFKAHPADLLLPLQRWTQQQLGGTWSEIFNSQTLLNHRPWVGALVWYLSLALLGLIVFPILRLALPGLPDRGYPLARTAGMLILSYVVWVAGSYQVPFTRNTISIILLALVVVGIGLAIWQRHELGDEWRKNKRYYLMIEGLFLAFFLLDLLIRLGNPDLWHPYKGGEKPMDFAYFNAILKSTSFPPYDPWFAGGYLNYYYYGFVLVGTLVKWLGITPSIAYNLILPTMFALIAMGAFSIAWNIYVGAKHRNEPLNTGPDRIVNDPIPTESEAQLDLRGSTTEQASQPSTESELKILAPQTPIPVNKSIAPFWVGLSGALGMALLGNLGTVKMIYQGFQRLAAPGGLTEDSTLLMRLIWAAQGFAKNLAGTPLPYGIGDWYWNPSRAIPAPGEVEPITEFPFFTVLYADPHAHLYAMSLALLAIGFALSVILARGRWKGILGGLFGFLIGALAIGALRPTNTWDFYTYLALGVVALAYALWRYYQPITLPAEGSRPRSIIPRFFAALPAFAQRLIVTFGGVGLLTGLSVVLFIPFLQWYGLGYSKIDFWQGLRTPLNAYFTHWGLFLFVIVSWLIWETRDWLANTPVSALRKLSPYRGLIIGAVAFLVLTTIALAIKLPQTVKTPFGNGIGVAIVALPLAAWAGILILRPDQPDAKRFTLFLIGTGLVLTLMVEIIVLIGDIGRMNTVFKFYLQVWTLFAVSAAAALGWLLASLFYWSPGWRNTWVVILAVLVAGAMLFPLTAGRAKILDRMNADAPHTLDGMKFMEYSTYDWQGPMDLSQDYRAIRWMQENVQGSPVIVEANLRDLYRWGSRFSIYTGLPGVVGWEFHQQQQRALVPGSWVSDRINEVDNFYNTTDLQSVKEFLAKYNVKYIILGQLERNHYPGPGLDKFSAQTGILWNEVYRDGNTQIYEVIGSGG